MKIKLNFAMALIITAALTVAGVVVAEELIEAPSVILIKNVHVWDGTSDALKEDTDVLIVGNKIRKVAKDIPESGTYDVDAVRKTITLVPDAPGIEAKGYNINVKGEESNHLF